MEDFMSFPCEPEGRRSECSQCGRPSSVCLCPFLPKKPIDIKSSVYIVQHPREEKRPVRTDYLVRGCLPDDKCFILKGKRFSPKRYCSGVDNDGFVEVYCNALGNCTWTKGDPPVVQDPGSFKLSRFKEKRHPALDAVCNSPNTIILYPGPSAVKITEVPELCESNECYNIIVVDGTWAQAKGIFRNNSLLQKPLQVQLSDMGPSEFVIRVQPTYESLSTVESVAIALSVLEKRPQIRETMLTALRGLCQLQLDCGAVEHHCREFHKNRSQDNREDVGDR